MIKKILSITILIASFAGVGVEMSDTKQTENGTQVTLTFQENENFIVSEYHLITRVKGNKVYGENVSGTGEGIFYTAEQMKMAGVENVRVGDLIKFNWTKENFENEEWDMFTAEKLN